MSSSLKSGVKWGYVVLWIVGLVSAVFFFARGDTAVEGTPETPYTWSLIQVPDRDGVCMMTVSGGNTVLGSGLVPCDQYDEIEKSH